MIIPYSISLDFPIRFPYIRIIERETKMVGQKDMVKVLDRAAARATNPASSKQTWFLAGLITKSASAETDYQDWLLNTSISLSKREASELIDQYKH